MKTETKKQLLWATLMILFLFVTGCGSKKTVTEKVVTKVDSTAVVSLQTELSVKNAIIENMKTDLERTRDENVRLQDEVSKHEVEYDTSEPINPQTGKPPVKKETTTNSKSVLERRVEDYEVQLTEYKKEVETLTLSKSNLEYELNMVKRENSDIKTNSAPVFNLKSFLWGIVTGAVLLFLLILFLRR